MATNGILKFQGTNKATFVGATSNVVIDTVKSSLGIGVDVDGPTSNLHVVGNAYVSTELTVTGNVAVDTDTLFVDTVNDRVGIGTTTPGSTLDVNGSLRAAYDQDVTSYIGKSALGGITYGATFAHKDMNTQFRYALRQTSAGQTMINTKGDQSISFRVGDTEKAKITSGGDFLVDTDTLYVDVSENRVGIGTTSPAQKLDVNGNIKLGGSGRQIYLDTGGAGLYWGSGYSRIVDDGDLRICTDDNLHFNTNCSSGSLGIERMVLKANGSVGIGVTAPDRLFHVNGTSRFVGEVEWSETGQSTSHANYGANRDWYIRSGAADGKVVIQDIHATSNVGIGTSTPGYKLDVTGDIRFTGDIYKGNVLQALNSPFLTNGVAPNRKAYYTDGPVGIANVSALTTQTLQIGANVVVNDTANDKLVVSGNVYVAQSLHAVDLIESYEVRANFFTVKNIDIRAERPRQGGSVI
jgi:hypothetical protein